MSSYCIAQMSYMLPHLQNGWQVEQAILTEEDKVVVIRFGNDWDPSCEKMDGALFKIAEKVKNSEMIYLVDVNLVPDFNEEYKVSDTCSLRFFFRNKQIMIDSGNGNNQDINWPLEDKQKMISIFETVYDEAKKGKDVVVLPQD
ncbi:unnamed protein product [Callosobruchus maculatus]|uniref:Thioredoxin-like protein n=1 Tax=Callosobruchus maculatus TaxID=64391 RepID=A0A653DMY0_CALMS|nr:unnamed protein product [Callosobruchus maculatus]